MDKCFNIQEAISCQSLIPIIVSNCKSHPNTLLACNDTRLPQYPLILKQAQEAQKRAEEAQKRAEEAEEASVIINTCSNNSTAFSCDVEMRLLQRDCQLAPSPHDYCKNELFLGYLTQHNILNSTVSP